jgi:Asp-tRNA(Asn)/Glu-tRNA(Gln) amidotransferase A subunit family amidase
LRIIEMQTVGVKGWDGCIGYSAWVGKPAESDSALIRLLRDAGAVPFVKTAVPITLLSFESASDVFGRTTNPHKKTHAPGGSTGGEAALLAYGGSRIGVGTDVAGSVRVPAHYSGVYTIKASTGRFMKMGSSTSMPGQDGVPPVYSPMARTLEDLDYFWKAIMSMEPWKYDHTVHPIPWRDVDLSAKPLKWGVMWDDGVVSPSPACKRALEIVVRALSDHGHQVVDM